LFTSLRTWLSNRHAYLLVIGLTTLLSLPALFTGRLGDDFIHAHILSGSAELSGYRLPWWRLFDFASPRINAALFDDGILPWWADPDSQLSFFRPLSALTHRLDYALWPQSAVLMHAHSLGWAILALGAIWALYRHLLSPPWVATLALALYAFASSRGITVSWIANRNALIASAFSVSAVALYLRAERGSAWLRAASALCFGLGLLAAEGAAGAGAYLLSAAIFLVPGGVKRRTLSLLPHVLVGLTCVLLARLAGYGVFRSDEYLDPLNDPRGFLGALAQRSLIGLFAAVGGPSSEWWNGYELIIPGLSHVVLIGAVLVLLYCGALLTPVIAQSRTARFWASGTALSLLPAAAAPPGGRVLTWVSLGVMGLIAEYLAYYAEGKEDRGPLATAGAYGFVFLHLIISPLSLPGQCWNVAHVQAMFEKVDRAVARTPEIRDRTVIYLNPPQDTFAIYNPAMRAAHGEPRPRTQRWLATGLTSINVERVDSYSLELVPKAGFFHERTERVVRSSRYPFARGQRVRLSGLVAEIRQLTADGRPGRVRFIFDRPLEHAQFLWLVWRGDQYVPYTPPSVGQTEIITAADFVTILFGADSGLPRLFSSIRKMTAADSSR
jgi:hypothetical protein